MIKAIIFDLDGVLIDAKEMHYQALNKALAEHGFHINMDEHLTKYDGLPTLKKLKLLTKEKGLPERHYDNIWKRKQHFTLKYINENFTDDQRIISILDSLKKKGLKIVVCSNSIRESLKLMLSKKGFIDFLEFYLSNEDVVHPKPHPEIYLRAFVKLGLSPKECMIVEDSHHGRQSAFESGGYLCTVKNSGDLELKKIEDQIRKVNHLANYTINHPKWENSALTVVVPMAGDGKSFKNAGYIFPKPLVDINNKPMIHWVIENLNIEARFVFLCKKEDINKYNLNYLLKYLVPDCTIIPIENNSGGAVKTILQAKDILDNDSPLLIVNSDQYIEWNSNEFYYKVFNDSCDGSIVIFESTHPMYSFVKVDENGLIIEVAEKKTISNNATAGIYFFRTGKMFIEYAQKMIEKQISINGEYFVCPVYNELIMDSKVIRPYNVEKVYSFSTPKDLEYFTKQFLR